MESLYRRWVAERKAASNDTGNGEDASGDLLRELHTALGTAKWQVTSKVAILKRRFD